MGPTSMKPRIIEVVTKCSTSMLLSADQPNTNNNHRVLSGKTITQSVTKWLERTTGIWIMYNPSWKTIDRNTCYATILTQSPYPHNYNPTQFRYKRLHLSSRKQSLQYIIKYIEEEPKCHYMSNKFYRKKKRKILLIYSKNLNFLPMTEALKRPP